MEKELKMRLQMFASDVEEDKELSEEELNGEELVEEELVDEEELNEEELRKKVKDEFQSELDRRVTKAIQKREKALKSEFEKEKKKLQMSEEEKRKLEEEERQQQLLEKEQVLLERETKLNIIEVIEEEELDIKFKNFVNVNDYIEYDDVAERKTAIKEKIESLTTLFNSKVEEQVENFKADILKGKTPEKLDNSTQESVSEYQKAKKNSDIKGMLKAKFQN